MKLLKLIVQVYGKSSLLIFAIVAGIFVPQGHIFSFCIQYLLMFILFLAFLDLKIKLSFFNTNVISILIANVVLAITFYLLLFPIKKEIALLAFITAIAPTANSAPVIISYINGKIGYVLASVLVSNITIAFLIPFMLYLIAGRNEINSSTGTLLISTLYTILVPIILSQLAHYAPQNIINPIRKINVASFYVLLVIIFLSASKASYFVLNEFNSSKQLIFLAAITSLTICIISFSLGHVMGNKDFAMEASQSLGHKNTTFTIWLSLTFLDSYIALGPIFYIIYQNFYNSFRLYRYYARGQRHKESYALQRETNTNEHLPRNTRSSAI